MKYNITTICLNLTASMATLLLSSGVKGKRFAINGSKISPYLNLHIGKPGNVAHLYDEEPDQLLSIKNKVINIMANNTCKDIKKVQVTCEVNHYINVYQAKEFGLIDEIIQLNSLSLGLKRLQSRVPLLKTFDHYIYSSLINSLKELKVITK